MTRAPNTTVAIGIAKEQLACQYLEAQGLQVVARNVRYRGGELDIIMRDGECLVFVEVRYRRNDRFGSAAESITWTKRRRIRTAARQYLQRYPSKLDCRFDVLAITGTNAIEWLRDAFQDG